MKIQLKSLKKESFEIEVSDGNVTVQELKQLIEMNFGFDYTKLKLIFNSAILEDSKTLNDYNISDGFTLVMSNLKAKKVEDNTISSESNKPVVNSDDLGLYSNENAENISNKEDINSNSIGNINKITTDEDASENISEEKVYEADIKAENAVQYVASIMKVLCLQEPEKGKEFFKNFEEDNPQIMRLIKKNDAEFKRLLYSPKTDQDVEIFKKFYAGQIKEVDPDSENIKKLMDYGFPYNKAKEAYNVCDKQFELALNFLLEGNI